MTLGGYVAGVAVLTVIAVAAAVIGVSARLVLLPGRDRAISVLADVVLALAAVVAGAQVLGVLGILRADLLAAALAVTAIAVARRVRRSAPRVTEPPPPPPKPPRAAALAAVVAVALVAGQWAPRVLTALDHGMLADDDLHYHLPFAARFAADHATFAAHYTAPGGATQFLPANSELLHAVGMSAFGRDVLSPLLNLGWLALALLASWCIGRRRGAGPVAVVGLAALLASPLLARTQPGGAMNDVVEIALLLSACALWLEADTDRRVLLVAALAAGLGIGNKPSMLVPAGVLALATLLRGDRIRSAGIWVAGGALGATWYLRNLAVTGNPFPTVEVDLGPLHLPAPRLELIERFGFTVLDYATDVEVWRSDFVPGLRVAFGPAWPVLVVAAVIGIAAAAWRGSPARPLALVAVAGLAAYAAIPGSAWGTDGHPVLFAHNLRWATSSLALALTCLALARWVQRPLGAWLVIALAGTALAGAQLAGGVWPGWAATHRRAGVSVVVLVVTIGVLVAGARGVRRYILPAVAGLTAAALVAGFPLARRYLDNRYADDGHERGVLYAWAREVRDARIAVAGFYQVYPLHGMDLSNDVRYLGRVDAQGGHHEISTCPAWLDALDRGRYDFVVVAPLDDRTPEPPQAGWTRGGGAVEVVRSGRSSVFRVDGPLDDAGCDRRGADERPTGQT
jgi:hypothetical protein